jgi:ABC-type antimicrobial peptide transport system permease subunit
MRQIPTRTLEVSFRTQDAIGSVLPSVRDAVSGLDPSIPIFAAQPLREAYDGLTATPRFAAFLMGLFSLLALVLAGVGIYGVLAFTVGQRAPEIALRRALGAGAGNVAGSVVAGAMRLAALGLVVGGTAAFLGSGVLRTFLFQVDPTDPATFAGVAGTMLAVAVAAAALPAYRAARRSPAEVLNAD